MDVAQWLQDLGLPDYAALFRAQAIDADVLPSLTDADFEKLGLPLGACHDDLTAWVRFYSSNKPRGEDFAVKSFDGQIASGTKVLERMLVNQCSMRRLPG
jgi:hypothetical protein